MNRRRCFVVEGTLVWESVRAMASDEHGALVTGHHPSEAKMLCWSGPVAPMSNRGLQTTVSGVDATRFLRTCGSKQSDVIHWSKLDLLSFFGPEKAGERRCALLPGQLRRKTGLGRNLRSILTARGSCSGGRARGRPACGRSSRRPNGNRSRRPRRPRRQLRL